MQREIVARRRCRNEDQTDRGAPAKLTGHEASEADDEKARVLHDHGHDVETSRDDYTISATQFKICEHID